MLYVGPGTTTPLSQLGIHDDLVTFGGFTAETARLALVDGQSPPNFTRPILPWVQAVPMHTPALGYGTFPAVATLPQIVSCSSSSSTTASISTTSALVMATPPIAQLTPMPQFGAIVVPPVITFSPSPPPRSTGADSSYQVLSVPLSPISTDAAPTATSTAQITTHAPSTSSPAAPILQWPSFVTATVPASMPVLDTASGPFPGLLGVPANNSAMVWPSPSASPLHVCLLVLGLLLECEVWLNPTRSSCLHLAVNLQLLNPSLLGRLLLHLPELTPLCSLPPDRSMVALFGPISGPLLPLWSLFHHRSLQTPPPVPLMTTLGRLPTVLCLYFLVLRFTNPITL